MYVLINLLTAGTTGDPKAAVLTHFNLINNSYFLGELLLNLLRKCLAELIKIIFCLAAIRMEYLNSQPPTRVCSPPPLYHWASFTAAIRVDWGF